MNLNGDAIHNPELLQRSNILVDNDRPTIIPCLGTE